MEYVVCRKDELYHHGIKGQKWGIRRFQNEDGSLTSEGKTRYGSAADYATPTPKEQKAYYKNVKKVMNNSRLSTTKKMVEIAKKTPQEIHDDLKPFGEKIKASREKYKKEYSSEVDKIVKNDKKLREFAKKLGVKDEDVDKIDINLVREAFLRYYRSGYDVLGAMGHTTKSLDAAKKAFQEDDRKLYSEAADFTNKLLGKYGDKPVSELLAYGGYLYKRTSSAKTWTRTALEVWAENQDSLNTAKEADRIASSNGIRLTGTDVFGINVRTTEQLPRFRRM